MITDRLQQILDHFGLNQTEAANRLGINQQNLSLILKGKRPFGKNMQKRVASEFDVSEEWLLTGEGEMLKRTSHEHGAMVDAEGVLYTVPLIPIGAFAGEVQGFSCEGVMLDECEQVTSPVPGCDIAIDVSGDSMEPDFPNGCRVFCRRINDAAFIPWGNVFVLDTENGAFIKKLMPIDGDDTRIAAISLNSDYPTFEIPKTSIYGLYRVLMMARGYSAI